MASNESKPIETLLNILHYDSSKRLEVLREEITHLGTSISYRIEKVDGNGATPHPDGRNKPQPTSQSAFLQRLQRSATVLLRECEFDLAESRGFRGSTQEERLLANSRGSSSTLSPRPAPPMGEAEIHDELAKQYKRELMWNAKIISKALVIAERLGDLHDKLEQFLQRTNPDQPDPTLRRRSEQGLADKYLSEKTRWVHKDLARLMMHLRDGQYPFDEVPSTYQFWAYDHTSHHHSFTSLKAHHQWAHVTERPDGDEKAGTVERFVCLSLSYWVPDRIALVPIIGHELAHEVLRATYGRLLNVPRAERDPTEMARVHRRLTRVTEAWLSNHMATSGAGGRSTDALVNEILCDVLATIRFGYAYVYAWTLEMLADERLANLFHDQYGMLRRADFGTGVGDLHAMSSDAEAIRAHLNWSPPLAVYRGRVLLAVLRGLELEKDPIAEQFGAAFETLLELMLDLYAGPDPARKHYERQLAEELSRAVCEETLFEDAGVGIGESKFLTLARTFWSREPGSKGTPKIPTLEYQCMTEGFRQIVKEALSPLTDQVFEKKIDAFDVLNCPNVTGVAWRCEWLLDLAMVRADRSTPATDGAASMPSKDEARDIVRRLNFLAMDDYLFQTLHPARLFAALGKSGEDYQISELLGDSTNLLDDEATRRSYRKDAVVELDRLKLEKPTRRSSEIAVRDTKVQIATAALQWLGGPVLDGGAQSLLRQSMVRSGEHPSRTYFLDLMKLRMDGAAAGLDFHIKPKALADKKNKYEVKCDGALLGRYDAYVLYCQNESHGTLGWDFRTGPVNCASEPQSITCAHASRGRRMVRIYSSSPYEAVQSPFAVVLVSLKWDASRLVVANWLIAAETRASLGDPPMTVFLSDGWEDLVVFIGVDQAQPTAEAVAEQFGFCRAMIQLLNKNPFIATTESLFTRRLLVAPPKQVKLRFACRVGDNGYESARTKLDAIIDELGADGIECRDVAGNKDFEISVEHQPQFKPKQVELLHERLHTALGASCRIETRVSWSSRSRVLLSGRETV
jgi:hypothetical protein